jgi:hypothetical protein
MIGKASSVLDLGKWRPQNDSWLALCWACRLKVLVQLNGSRPPRATYTALRSSYMRDELLEASQAQAADLPHEVEHLQELIRSKSEEPEEDPEEIEGMSGVEDN